MRRAICSGLVFVSAVLFNAECKAFDRSSTGNNENLMDDNVGLILNLLGGDSNFLGDVLNGNGNILEQVGNSLYGLLDGKAELLGGLLNSSGDLLGGLGVDVSDLLSDLVKGKVDTLNDALGNVGGFVGGVLQKIGGLAENLVTALQEVDIGDSNAVRVAFSPMPINLICPACHLLNKTDLTKACKVYCTNTCHWQF
ncbi:hypothetical protein BsWGS_15092 [Bradybaena similaris]